MVYEKAVQIFKNSENHSLRFFTNSRASQATRLSGELTAKEFIAAELVILKLTQQESFKDMDEPRLRTLDMYKDEDELLRLRS